MKNMILVCMLAGTLAAQAQGRFTIEGNVSGVDSEAVFYLFKTEGNVGTQIAVDTLRDGRFFLEGEASVNEAERYSISIGNVDKLLPMALDLWIEPGSHVKIKGEDALLYTWDVESEVDCQKLRQRFVDASREEWNGLQQRMMEIVPLRRSGQKIPEELSKEISGLQARINANNVRVLQQSEDRKNKAWMEELYHLAVTLKYDKEFPYREEIRELYEGLPDAWKDTDRGKSIHTVLFPPVVVKDGDMAADADLYDLEGKVHHLSEFRGKYVLLDFWSRGCGPCILSQPELKEISGLYKDSLEVVSLSTESEKGWKESAKSHPMTWNNWNDLQGMNGLYARYGVNGIPHFVLINPDGRIRTSWSGYGKGLLKVALSRWMRPALQPVYSVRDGISTVENPIYENSNTQTVEITKVERTDSATILHIHAYYIPKYWIQISKEVRLVADDGTVCPVLRSENFPLGERFFMPESGETTFTLYFSPLPADVRSFDFTEGDNAGDWHVKGVRIAPV